MARQRFIYRNGKAVEVSTSIGGLIKGESVDDFDTRMRKTLYQLECEKGNSFRVPGFSKDQLKKVWFDNAERVAKL